MLQNDLQNGIVVKTKDGLFKLLKNGQLEELPSDGLAAVRHNEVLPFQEPVKKIDEALTQKKSSAGFYFTVDDERDIRELRDEKLEEKNIQIKQFIDKTAESIIRVAKDAGIIVVADQEEQVKKIILSRFKDIRSLSEAKEALASPLIMRNRPLGKKEIELLLALVERQRPKVEEVIRTGKIPELEPVKMTEPEAVQKVEIIRIAAPAAEPPRGVQPQERKNEPVVGYGADEKGGQYYQHIITGPVEEIKNLSLKDFRKLGASPEEAAGRIWEKINLLEDESLIKKDEGTRAWRQSEVYRLYLLIGAESMAEKKSVSQVVAERQATGKPFLTPQEFNVVSDLNRKLIY